MSFSSYFWILVTVKVHTLVITQSVLLTSGFLWGYLLSEGSPYCDSICFSLHSRCCSWLAINLRMQSQSVLLWPSLDPLVCATQVLNSAQQAPRWKHVLLKVFTAVLMDLIAACHLFQSACPNTDFTCAGRCYYIVVVPVSESTRKLRNPEEIGLEEVSASWWLIG